MSRLQGVPLGALVLALVSGCHEVDVAALKVTPSAVEVGAMAQVDARVRHPASARVVYRWRAQRGYCDPETTTEPSTGYIAPSEPGEDQVTVEALGSNDELFDIATARVFIRAAEQSLDPSVAEVEPRIEVTTVPPYDPVGGPSSRATIAGFVSGLSDPAEYRLVLYAYTDFYYVQPLTSAPFIRIDSSGRWSTWTHTGSHYLLLLVPSDYQPQDVMVSPAEAGPVISQLSLEGDRTGLSR